MYLPGDKLVLIVFLMSRELPFSAQVLFNQAPNYERAVQAGKDARHLWFTLREWRGDDPEGYFGDLGAWAERRMMEPGVH
jgi:hypothetical protein